ncbi:MAG: NUDIX domain-containing protein [Candidatus Aenigmarchaeota archaeon]|nr:NUDIX domain-containing protein [Candidatus Aenigmarchaeota archaeon]
MGNEVFKPKPGQIDYTNIKRAPVINCIVKYKDKILIVQRSSGMKFYPNCWNGVSGFLDDNRGINQKVEDELKEEVGIEKDKIISIIQGKVFDQDAPEYNKIWIVYPVLIEVNSDQVKLDWEAQNYQWIKAEETKNFKLMPGFNRVLKALKLE